MSPKVHDIAQTGFGAGTNELYDRARPSYPDPSLAYLRTLVKDKDSVNIVELGAGTGLFTRALLKHPDWSSSVNKLRATEPSEGMREVFAKNTVDPRVSIEEGFFDSTKVEDGWADLIVVAQAFHWCPDYDGAAKEFARILKPDGVAVLIWNLEDRDGATWVAQLRDRIEIHERGTPQFRLGLWRQLFETASYKQLFRPHEEEKWSYALLGSADIVVDRACSKSYIATLPEDEKAKVIKDVKAIVQRGDGLVWTDEKQGFFEYPYSTLAVVCRKS